MSGPETLRIALMLESDGPGGAEHVLLHLVEGLRSRGHDAFPVLRRFSRGKGWLQAQFRQRGIEPELFHLRRPVDWGCVRGLVEVFRRRQVDVVHSHEFTMAVYGAVAARLVDRPHIITMHGSRAFGEAWRRRVALGWAVRHSRSTVGVSRATADYVERTLRRPGGSVGTVANGIMYHPGRRDPLRRELQVRPDECLLVTVGNLYPVKGHIVLLRALAALRARRPELAWKAALIGRGGEEATLRTFIEAHGLEDRVHLLGFRTDVPDVLAGADVWVMPSLSEGMPLSLLEAMFAGKAIVASRVGGIPEVAREDEEALLFPVGDDSALEAQLARLLEHDTLRARLGQAARDRAEQEFRLEHTIERYEALYRGRT